MTDLDGKFVAAIGTGEPGRADGAYDKCQFHDPQGMAVAGDTLYVADRKNHLIRALDLKAKTVTTVAGNGTQEHDAFSRRLDKPGPGAEHRAQQPVGPARRGRHALYRDGRAPPDLGLDLKKKEIVPYAGSGRENIGDGPLAFANFAQPSGLATDGKNLYVADSEISALRKVPLGGAGRVETLVGRGLFVFGDQDGPGQVEDPLSDKKEARLQHALGVAHHDGKLYVADTYNSKVRVFDLKTKELTTLVGGNEWGWLVPPDVQRAGRDQLRGRQALRRRHQRPPHPRGGPRDEEGDDARTAGRQPAARAEGTRSRRSRPVHERNVSDDETDSHARRSRSPSCSRSLPASHRRARRSGTRRR